MKLYQNLDASESLYLSRQLEHIRSRVYEIRYPELLSRTLVPRSPDAAPDGVNEIFYETQDSFGASKIIAPGSKGKDLPRVNVKASEESQKVREMGVAFEYTLGEIKKAAYTGKNLPDKLAKAARRALEQQLDDILALGDSDYDLNGFLNNSNVTPVNATTGDWTGAATVDQILADMNEPAITMQSTTKGIFGTGGLTMLLPLAEYGKIATTPRSTTSDTTILEFFLKSQSFVSEVLPWYKLSGIGAGGSSDDRMVVYKRDPEVLNYEVPREMEMLDVQVQGLSYSVPCTMSTAGVIVHQPKAIIYRDAIR